jgi:hypothetical protein
MERMRATVLTRHPKGTLDPGERLDRRPKQPEFAGVLSHSLDQLEFAPTLGEPHKSRIDPELEGRCAQPLVRLRL